MRSDRLLNPGFIAGLGLGVALAGVAVLTVEAARRIRSRRMITEEHLHIIDGVYALEPPALDARPAEEGNAPEIPRLESEAPDIPPMSQRW